MDNSGERTLTAFGAVGYRGPDPARLCCALTRLSRALASRVPRSEMRIDYLRGVCDCRGFRSEETACCSGDEAS
jgi:hypothetical protein